MATCIVCRNDSETLVNTICVPCYANALKSGKKSLCHGCKTVIPIGSKLCMKCHEKGVKVPQQYVKLKQLAEEAQGRAYPGRATQRPESAAVSFSPEDLTLELLHQRTLELRQADLDMERATLDGFKNSRSMYDDMAARFPLLETSMKVNLGRLKTDIASHFEEFRTRLLEEVTKLPPRILNIVANDVHVSTTDKHFKFIELVRILSTSYNERSLPVYVFGPAGSAKTTAAHQAAEALSQRFAAQAVCVQTSKFDLIGGYNAHGDYVTTMLRDFVENGGVFLLDEIDNGNPNVLAVLNSIIEQDIVPFPDKMVSKHKDFKLIAAANTIGAGADRQYVGRNQLDGATLSRFVYLEWPYDEKLEKQLAGKYQQWCRFVQLLRYEVNKTNMRCIISTRAVIQGAALFGAGFDWDYVANATIFHRMSNEDKAKLENIFNRNNPNFLRSQQQNEL